MPSGPPESGPTAGWEHLGWSWSLRASGVQAEGLRLLSPVCTHLLVVSPDLAHGKGWGFGFTSELLSQELCLEGTGTNHPAANPEEPPAA